MRQKDVCKGQKDLYLALPVWVSCRVVQPDHPERKQLVLVEDFVRMEFSDTPWDCHRTAYIDPFPTTPTVCKYGRPISRVWVLHLLYPFVGWKGAHSLVGQGIRVFGY